VTLVAASQAKLSVGDAADEGIPFMGSKELDRPIVIGTALVVLL
jgi:hypothetical protein